MCWQAETISDLLLSKQLFFSFKIVIFSSKHKLHYYIPEEESIKHKKQTSFDIVKYVIFDIIKYIILLSKYSRVKSAQYGMNRAINIFILIKDYKIFLIHLATQCFTLLSKRSSGE